MPATATPPTAPPAPTSASPMRSPANTDMAQVVIDIDYRDLVALERLADANEARYRRRNDLQGARIFDLLLRSVRAEKARVVAEANGLPEPRP